MEILLKDERSKKAFAKKHLELVDVIHEHIGSMPSATVSWSGHSFCVETDAGKIHIDEQCDLF